MIQHISNLARRKATEVKDRVSQIPHNLRSNLKHHLKHQLSQHLLTLVALALLVFSMGGTWTLASSANAAPNHPTATAVASTNKNAPGRNGSGSASAAEDAPAPSRFATKKAVTGKLNLNTATEDQLMLLPTIGPSKAERIVTWRKKNGGFKRTADLRRVKGFGYKTFKRLEPFLDIKGDTTLSAKR
jgi:competence ComEA-like helix-hairpin-helix protein